MTSAAPDANRWVLLAMAVLLFGSLIHVHAGYSSRGMASEHAAGLDDAYVSYRYAANLLAGEGLTYNPGGERVEGYSNLLWVLYTAALLAVVGPGTLHAATATSSVLLLLLCAGLFYRRLFTLHGATAATLGVVMTSLWPTLWVWPASGLETTAVLTVQIALWYLVTGLDDAPADRRLWRWLAASLVASILLRADGFVAPLVVVAHFGLRRQLRLAARSAAVTALATGAVFAFRLAYYGEWLPNTYYAKVDVPLMARLLEGGKQLHALLVTQGMLAHVLLALWPLGAALLCLWRSRDLQATARELPFASSLSAALCLYFVLVGGDHFGERFLLAVVPLGIASLLRLSARGAAGPVAPASWAVGLLLCLQLTPWFYDTRFTYSASRYDCWLTLGEYLREHRPGATLATGAAGKLPFVTGFHTIDTLGLNDRHIAHTAAAEGGFQGHRKSDPAYVLSQHPDLIAGTIDPSLYVMAFPRADYEAAGYRISLLVNTTRTSMDPNVVSTAGWDPGAIGRAIAMGYRYAVLEPGPARPAP